MADNPRLEDLKRRVLQDPASIAFAALADEYRRAGLFHEAIETCRAGLLRHPAYLSARVTLGRCLIELGDYDEAQGHLEQVIRIAPDNLAAIRALADIHHKRGLVPDNYAPAAVPPAAVEPPAVQARVVPMAPRPPASPADAEPPTASGVTEAPPPTGSETRAAVIAETPASHVAPPVSETVVAPPPPSTSPAQDQLERFLAAIVRARASGPAGNLHSAH